MTSEEETIIYDALHSLTKHSKELCDLVNAMPEGDAKKAAAKAYRDGVYAPAIKLQVILGEEAIARGKLRYEEREARAREFFSRKGH